jgi:hypothetical protein
LDALTGLKFRFMDDQEQWHTSWPPLLANPGTVPRPKAIEVSLTVQPWGELRRIMLLPR